MKNIHIIPTDKPSKFVKDNVMYDYYFYLDVKIKSNLSYTAQNIYITNDEEIREGDWYLGFETNYSKEPKERWVLYNCVSKPNGDYSEKIILTTDQDLIKDGVQEIPEYFLIHYIVGNNPIEYVEIKEHLESIDTMKINYELIIPKEEPKERLKKILGTKHTKQERMYSEKEVMSILINSLHSVELKDNKDYSKVYNGMKEWFEQFKKK